MIKKFTYLLLTLSTLALTASEIKETQSEKNCTVFEQAEKKAKSYLSSKKHKKHIQSLVDKVIDKKDDLIIRISESQLSDQQKAGMIEILDTLQDNIK